MIELRVRCDGKASEIDASDDTGFKTRVTLTVIDKEKKDVATDGAAPATIPRGVAGRAGGGNEVSFTPKLSGPSGSIPLTEGKEYILQLGDDSNG